MIAEVQSSWLQGRRLQGKGQKLSVLHLFENRYSFCDRIFANTKGEL